MEARRGHRSRLIIADDHTLVAELCKNLLEPEFEVVAVVSDGRELVQAVNQFRPDVVVLDLAMPHMNGLLAAQQIRQEHPTVKLIFLTMNMNEELAVEAFRSGASGYVVKHCSAQELTVAVRLVLRGQSFISPTITKSTVDFLLRTGAEFGEEKLTNRQAEVLQLMAEGKSMKEVAYMLSIKAGTVAFHKYRMMEALRVKSNAELLRHAIKRNLI